ncbi:MAG TPA: polysaccharide pyruvyl transferase family protein [Planctomycetota bacterium]|nr:polysaccharide pyruvyl transferase family protein [Planctomycetota bacterium]
MNVIISGPFGRGSLADEAVLAGVLVHFKEKKHGITVLSADPKATHSLHDVEAIFAGEPTTLLGNKAAWAAFSKAHLFVLAGAGTISSEGKLPARHWLAQLEHAQTAGLKTALVAAGAIPIGDARERARVQRLLHHNVEGIAMRDAQSKTAVMSYGMNANRISSNGDPTIALTPAETMKTSPASPLRLGLVLAPDVPSRTQFGFESSAPPPEFELYITDLVKLLLKTEDMALQLFHDDSHPMHAFAGKLRQLAPDKITAMAADRKTADIQAQLAACRAVFSVSLHGLILAAASETPVAGLNTEPGASDFLGSLGLPSLAIAPDDPALAAKTLHNLINSGDTVRQSLKTKLVALRKKEAQNARMLELLVPRRVERERQRETVGFSTDKPAKFRQKPKAQRGTRHKEVKWEDIE